MTVSLWVPGIPVPQGSMIARSFPGRGAFVAPDNSAKLKRWRAAIRAAAALAFVDGVRWESEPVDVELEFVLARPATVRRQLPSVRPDVDKLARAVLDGLTGVAFRDDGQVVRLVATKSYGAEQGVRIAAGEL